MPNEEQNQGGGPSGREPAPLQRRVKTTLQEVRFLLLGVQVLLGFQGRAALLPGAENLSAAGRAATVWGLLPVLLCMTLLFAPVPYHQIVNGGRDSERFYRYLTGIAKASLFPLAAGLGVALFVATDTFLPAEAAALAGGALTLGALGGWKGLTALAAARRRGREGGRDVAREREEQEAVEEDKAGGGTEDDGLSDRIDRVLSEASCITPGNSALLSFGFITMMLQNFNDLPMPVKYVQLAAVGCIAASLVLLILPAAYHRIVENGDDSEEFYRLASRLVVGSLVPLALGVAGGVFVATFPVTNSYGASGALGAGTLALFWGAWFGVTAYKKAARQAERARNERRGRAERPAAT